MAAGRTMAATMATGRIMADIMGMGIPQAGLAGHMGTTTGAATMEAVSAEDPLPGVASAPAAFGQ